MSERVLLVDDEPAILDGYRQNLRKRFELETASGPGAALDAIEGSGSYAVIVSRALLERLRTFAAGVGADEPVRVLVPIGQPASA